MVNKKKLPEYTNMGLTLTPKNGDVRGVLTKYIISTKGKKDLSYEFRYNKNIVPIFLVGGDDEKELPLVKFPLVITTNDVNYIVSNLSGTIKTDLTNSLIASKRNDYVDFEVLRNNLIYMTLSEKDTSYLSAITAQIATSFITKVITQHLRLDVFDSIDLEGAVFYYLINKYTNTDINNESIKTKMINMLSLGYKSKPELAEVVITRLANIDKDASIDKFINAVSTTSTTLQTVDGAAILSMLSNLWFSGSENSTAQMYIGIENFHTMASIIYHTLNTPTGKKSTLFRMLNDSKRSLRIDHFNSSINEIIKDVTI